MDFSDYQGREILAWMTYNENYAYENTKCYISPRCFLITVNQSVPTTFQTTVQSALTLRIQKYLNFLGILMSPY